MKDQKLGESLSDLSPHSVDCLVFYLPFLYGRTNKPPI